MRIRWNEYDIDEVRTISFTPAWNKGSDVHNAPDEIWFGGLDFKEDEWCYWGEVRMDAFESPKAAEEWVKAKMDIVMEKGYLDLSNCDEYIEIY